MKEDFIAVIELKSVGLGHLSDGGKINVHKDETNRVLEFEGDIYEVFSAPGYDKKNHCIVALAVKHGEDVFFSFETKKEYAVLYALFIDIKKSLKHCIDVSGIPFSDAIVCSNALITEEKVNLQDLCTLQIVPFLNSNFFDEWRFDKKEFIRSNFDLSWIESKV